MDINDLLKSCDRIYEDIIQVMNDESESIGNISNSLFAGKWGALLFMFYYERYCDPSKSNATDYLSDLYDNLDTSSNNFSICTGLSGPFWLLNHLHSNEFIDIEIDELLADFIPAAIECSEKYIEVGNFDFLHGSSGICMVLIKFAQRQDVQSHLAFFVKKLSEVSVEVETGLSIPLYYYHTDPPSNSGIDAFGLAHGTCAYQIILSKIYQLGIETLLCKKIIEGSMLFILNNENKVSSNSEALYPAYLDGETMWSRVSWCYGDLNVATALWQCGKYFNHKEWQLKAIDIYKYNTHRITSETTGVIDTCLCHGTAGNALMFMGMWKKTEEMLLKNCADHWYKLTQEMIAFSDNGHGIKTWQGKEKGWEYKWDMLDGSVGVGLALISAYTDKILPWEEILLIF